MMPETNEPLEDIPLPSEIVEKEEEARGNDSTYKPPAPIGEKDADGLLAEEVLAETGDEDAADSLLDIAPANEARKMRMNRFLFDLAAIGLFGVDLVLAGSSSFGSKLPGVAGLGLVAVLGARLYARTKGGGVWSRPNYYSGDPRRPVPSIVFRIFGWLLLIIVFLVTLMSFH